MSLSISDGFIKGYSAGESDPMHLSTANSEPLFKHSLCQVKKYSHIFGNHCTFLYFMRDPMEPNLLFCYLYQTEDPQDVSATKRACPKEECVESDSPGWDSNSAPKDTMAVLGAGR